VFSACYVQCDDVPCVVPDQAIARLNILPVHAGPQVAPPGAQIEEEDENIDMPEQDTSGRPPSARRMRPRLQPVVVP